MNRNQSQLGDHRTVAGTVRFVPILIAFVIGSLAAPQASRSAVDADAEAPSTTQQTWYVQTRVATDFGIVSTHYWSKGALFRAETMLAGHPVVTIVNGSRYYIFDSILGKGAAIERNAISIREDRERGRPFGRELDELIEAGGEKIHDASSREAGAAYEIYQLTNENGRRRVLVTKSDPPLPFRVETFVRKSGAEGTLEYSGWQRGLEIADSFFEPPSSISLESVTYDEYTRRVGKEPIGPAPVYYRDLLHGKRRQAD
ncbi:MAG: hypothetical protein JRJ58_23160 [Deltaproteobacteria bacterium]|nr:hypothetical protein [Deltaproteobacteria bacterium]